MQRSKNDVWVGLFVLIGAVAILFLALQAANLLSLNFQSNYTSINNNDDLYSNRHHERLYQNCNIYSNGNFIANCNSKLSEYL